MDQGIISGLADETTNLSTDTSPLAERASRWRDHLAEVYFGLDVQSPDGTILQGSLLKRALPNIKISELRGSMQRMIRTAALAKHDKIESYVFIAPITGSFEYAGPHIRDRATAGQIFALSSADYHEVAISGDARMTCFEVPADVIGVKTSRIGDFCAAGTFTDPLIASLLTAIGQSVLQHSTISNVGGIEKLCLDLVGVAIDTRRRNEAGRSPPTSVNDAVFSRFLHVLSRSYHDHHFGLTRCAAACGVSTRHLQSVLQARATSFSDELIRTRLDEARRLIKTPVEPPLAIGRIAALCGFVNQGYFATCYRRRYGVAPREDRFR